MGQQILRSHGLNFSDYFYWIPVGALLGFWIVFNIGFTFALRFVTPINIGKTEKQNQLKN